HEKQRDDEREQPDLHLDRPRSVVIDARDPPVRAGPFDHARLLDRERGRHQRGEEEREREEACEGERRLRSWNETFWQAHSRPASMMRARNSRVLGCRGALKISSGDPSSAITPLSRKQILCATSRAND